MTVGLLSLQTISNHGQSDTQIYLRYKISRKITTMHLSTELTIYLHFCSAETEFIREVDG